MVYRALYALLQPLTFDERNEALAAARAAVGCGEAPRPECRPMTSEELAELIRGGHLGACTTVERAVSAASDLWQLPRLVVHDSDGATLLKELEGLD